MKLLEYLALPFTEPNRKQSSHGESLLVLDGLRGLAVLVVIASHTSAFGMYGQGSLGVLMFFFLSGFVLTVPYANDPARLFRGNELFRFSANRVLRIVPIYVVSVVFIAWLLEANFNWILAHVVFYKGWNHLWSVAEEARFYLLFPIVVGALVLIRWEWLKLPLLALLIYFAYRYQHYHTIDLFDGRFVSFYFWMFLGGVLTCLLYKSSLVRNLANLPHVPSLLGLSAVVVMACLFFSSDYMIAYFWRPLIPSLPENLILNGWRMPGAWFFMFLVLFYSVTTFQRNLASRFLQHFFFRHMGLLSYSLYLFHMPIFLELRKFGFQQEGMFFATFALTYVVALASYVLIEKPFLMLKPKGRKARAARESGAASAAGQS